MTALIFPGQGADAGDPLTRWAGDDASEEFRDVEADAGISLTNILLKRPIVDTDTGQVATFIVTILPFLKWRQANSNGASAVRVVAGHSFGQVTAMVASSVLTLEEAIVVVSLRAQASYTAARARPGRMAAVLKCSLDDVESAIADVAPDRCWVANDNAPGQSVIAGDPAALDAVEQRLSRPGVRVVPLKIAGAFHTPFMRIAADLLRLRLPELKNRTSHPPIVLNANRPIRYDA